MPAPASATTAMRPVVTDLAGLGALVDALADAGYDVVGPTVRDGAIVTAPMRTVDTLPIGYTVDQAPGRATLRATGRDTAFDWVSPPQAWKPLLHPPHTITVRFPESQPDIGAEPAVAVAPPTRTTTADRPLALFGLRPCDLAAIEHLDRVLLERPPHPQPTYARRRDALITVVVDCGHPAPTCFCASTATGPHVDRRRSASVDIEITELESDDAPIRYLVEGHSDRGAALVEAIPAELRRPVAARDEQARRRQLESARAAQQRHLPSTDQLRRLHRHPDDPRWAEIAERCLACGNCTAVCPTCFCTGLVDTTDLGGGQITRERRWDSCFSLEFSRLGSAPVRSTVASRYRQWLVHKLDTWHDHFGESGCVGCGRCITWCPAGIDLVAEASRLSAVEADETVDVDVLTEVAR